jgi:hypothetical protein
VYTETPSPKRIKAITRVPRLAGDVSAARVRGTSTATVPGAMIVKRMFLRRSITPTIPAGDLHPVCKRSI